MTEQMIKGFSIYDDYVIYHDDREKKHRPIIPGATLQVISDIVLRWSYYAAYMLRTQKIRMDKSIETDSCIFKDSHTLTYDVTETYISGFSERPSIDVEFTSTSSDNYDYTASRSRDSSTAYKLGKSHPARETRFKAVRANIFRKEGDADVWIKSELARIRSIMCEVDEETKSLESWAKSGINMAVLCSSPDCFTFSIPIISPKQLHIYSLKGFSIKDLKEKLICKDCGTRNPILKAG